MKLFMKTILDTIPWLFCGFLCWAILSIPTANAFFEDYGDGDPSPVSYLGLAIMAGLVYLAFKIEDAFTKLGKENRVLLDSLEASAQKEVLADMGLDSPPPWGCPEHGSEYGRKMEIAMSCRPVQKTGQFE